MSQLSAPHFPLPGIHSLVKRVALYCRVSTKEQALGYSMDEQEEAGLSAVQAAPYLTLFKVYKDPGVSGTKSSRPGLDELREDIRNGFVDVVMVKAIDRIGRSERVLMPWFWMLEEAGVGTISLTQMIDTTTDGGNFALSMFIAMAQAEWRAIRTRTQSGLNAKAAAGGWVCGVPPYGYKLEGRGERGGSRVVPASHEIKVIKRAAYYMLEKGYSPERTAHQLNLDGHLTRSGVPWTGANLKLRMTGPILDGYTLFRSPEVRGSSVKLGPEGKPVFGPTQKIPLPQALDDDLVQGLRSYFAVRRTARGARTHLYYLSGRITGACGGRFVGRRVSQTKTHMYYCHEHDGNAKGCRYYRADLLEEAVWKAVAGFLSDRPLLEKAADDWIGALPVNGDDYRARITELDGKLSENERIRTITLVDYAKMGVDPEVVKAAMDKFQADAKELQSQRAVAQSLLSELETALERRERIVQLADVSAARLLTLAPEIRLQVMEMLDLRIEITKDTEQKRLAHPCKIEAYFRENNKPVPHTLTDEQWLHLVDLVPELSPRNRKISLRAILEAGFYKVRHNLRWKQLPEGFPGEMSCRAIWLQWVRGGVLEDMVDALGDYEGTPIGERDLPEMRITGVLEGTLASLMGQAPVPHLLRSTYTAPSGTAEILHSKLGTAPRPGFTLLVGA